MDLTVNEMTARSVELELTFTSCAETERENATRVSSRVNHFGGGGKLQEMGVALYTFLYNCPKFQKVGEGGILGFFSKQLAYYLLHSLAIGF